MLKKNEAIHKNYAIKTECHGPIYCQFTSMIKIPRPSKHIVNIKGSKRANKFTAANVKRKKTTNKILFYIMVIMQIKHYIITNDVTETRARANKLPGENVKHKKTTNKIVFYIMITQKLRLSNTEKNLKSQQAHSKLLEQARKVMTQEQMILARGNKKGSIMCRQNQLYKFE
ncbi:hypothetical protein MIMGU_mgv11b024230mg [Erythranthe guttata]|uniref:Uncharacterized protein n=1 Tax=Erythranthe guttata TaxID=4155 RepID=A0A022QEF4_ERYGU|nr:hypothetical protein MIMGU_mgv11b024230mg [Erythranthe guttata]